MSERAVLLDPAPKLPDPSLHSMPSSRLPALTEREVVVSIVPGVYCKNNSWIKSSEFLKK